MNYWQKFYKNKKIQKKILFPSQFAIFSLNEKSKEDFLIEFGCGNGRDAFFFSKYFKKVYAFDKSTNAITFNKINFKKQKNLFFNYQDINNNFDNKIFKTKNKMIYARFFLHSLKDKEIDNFIKNCSKILLKNEKILVEYRNKKDKKNKKIFNKHYRNYLNPNEIIKKFSKEKMKNVYTIGGFGYAKYKNEDASVTRQIFIKK